MGPKEPFNIDMNLQNLSQLWQDLKQRVRQNWDELSDEDIERLSGDYDEFIEVIQRRYGYSAQDAEREVTHFIRRNGNANSSA